jgi:hypothetical protein
MNEEWRDIAGSDGYQVSNHGQVRSLTRTIMGGPENKSKIKRRGRILQPQPTDRGLLRVHLGSMVKRTVAHLVLEAFVGPKPPKLEARYIDGRKDNVCVSNLYWGKRKGRGVRRRLRIVGGTEAYL